MISLSLSKLGSWKVRERILHDTVHPQETSDMDSGSPSCKANSGPPSHAQQALTFRAYTCHLGTREKVPLTDPYKMTCVGHWTGTRKAPRCRTTHVRSALPTWITPSYLQDVICELLRSIFRDFRCHLYNVAQFNPCRRVEQLGSTSDNHHPCGPARVTPHVPSAGCTHSGLLGSA